MVGLGEAVGAGVVEVGVVVGVGVVEVVGTWSQVSPWYPDNSKQKVYHMTQSHSTHSI